MAKTTLPHQVVDTLLHHKNTDRGETVILPVTRYQNIMSGPTVVTDSDEVPGAPFHLLKTNTEDMTIEEVRKLCGGII